LKPSDDQLQAQWKQQSDFNEAFSLYSEMTDLSSVGISSFSLKAARSWAHQAENHNHHSLLTAHTTSLTLLSSLISTENSAVYRHEILRGNAVDLSADAFSSAIHHGKLMIAVELLEQGRGIIWTQLMHLRTPVDDLSVSGDRGHLLAQKFVQLSTQLRPTVEGINPSRESPGSRQITTQ